MYKVLFFMSLVSAAPLPQLGDSFGHIASQSTVNATYHVLPWYATSQPVDNGNYIPNFSQDQCQQECNRRGDKCKFYVVPLNSSGLGDCRLFETLDKSLLKGTPGYKVKIKADAPVVNYMYLPMTSTSGTSISGVSASGVDQCQKACSAHAECTVFSVNKNDQSCVLKSGDSSQISSDSSWDSYQVNKEQRKYLKFPLNFPGSDISFYEGPTRNCPSLCDSILGCIAYTVPADDSGCWFKSSVPTSAVTSDSSTTFIAETSTDYHKRPQMILTAAPWKQRVDSASENDCKTTCNQLNGCIGFTVDTSGITHGCTFYKEIAGEAVTTQNYDLWLKKDYFKLQVLDGGQWKCVDQQKSTDPRYSDDGNFPLISTVVDCASADNSSDWNQFMFDGHGLINAENRYLSGWSYRIWDQSGSSLTTDSYKLDTVERVDIANRFIFQGFDTVNGSPVVNLNAGPGGLSGCLQINAGNVVFDDWSGDQVPAQCATFRLAPILRDYQLSQEASNSPDFKLEGSSSSSEADDQQDSLDVSF